MPTSSHGRISEYFSLNLTQPSLDFVDVPVEGDVRVFIDPSALSLLDTDWGSHCRSLIRDYFSSVLQAIKDGDDEAAKRLLSALNEPNETHLGYSSELPHGHGMGKILAEDMWNALKGSGAVRSGLIRDLEDTALMIDGVASDIISDITTNIIRGPLIQYTQAMCEEYGIPVEEVSSGLIWRPDERRWRSEMTNQPVAAGNRLLLVPKALVRRTITFDAGQYYNLYLLEQIQDEQAAKGFVRILKNGEIKPPTKKSLKRTRAVGKEGNRQLTPGREVALDRFRREKNDKPKEPLSHDDIASLTQTPEPDWDALLAAVVRINPGRAGAGNYEKAIKHLFDALFYPWLMYPEPQQEIHNGRKRIDITYTNVAEDDFFAWLRNNMPVPYVVIECKNYNGDPANPELDQLSSRFSPRRGRFGIMVVRHIENKDLFEQRCHDTANDDRGFIIVLDDSDLVALVEAVKSELKDRRLNLLRDKYRKLVM